MNYHLTIAQKWLVTLAFPLITLLGGFLTVREKEKIKNIFKQKVST